MNELLKIKEDLTKERDESLQEIVKLREQLAQSNATQQHLDDQKNEAEEKIQEVIFLQLYFVNIAIVFQLSVFDLCISSEFRSFNL